MTTPAASVIIINYNGGTFLKDAISALARQTFRDFELILFDNASEDGSVDGLDISALPACTVLRHPENIGFAAGNNRAAEHARGRWLLLLNPDTLAAPDWIETLLAAASRHPECRTFASAQYDLACPDLLDGAGDAYLIFGIPWRGGFGRPAADLPGPGWCFSACGAASMIDRKLFQSIGGFDERFFCYCEDVDLGFRLQLSGHDCLFVPDAVVRHAGSGITGRSSDFSTYHGTRNRIWTYFKNMPFILLVLTLPGHFVLTTYILAHNSLSPRRSAMIRGLIDGLQGIPEILRASPWKPARRTLSLGRLVQRMAWNPLRLHQRKVHVRPLQTTRPAQ